MRANSLPYAYGHYRYLFTGKDKTLCRHDTWIVGVVFGYAAIIVASYIPVVKRTGMTTSSLDIPQYILYYAMPVGFGLMVFWSIVNIVMDIKKIRNGDAGLDESDSVSMKTE